MVVRVKKIGGSIGVVIPRSVARELAISAGEEMTIRLGKNGVILEKVKASARVRQPLAELLSGIRRADYARQSKAVGDWGVVGREVW